MSEKNETSWAEWLAESDLDTDEVKARAAAGFLAIVLGKFHRWYGTLEDAAKALESSAPGSSRATAARQHLSAALTACDDVVLPLSDARDALDFGWRRESAR